MKKFFNWQIVFSFCLGFLSVSLYFIHYKIFHDLHHIFIYLLGDVAFVPVEVLLVTLIIHQLLSRREKREKLKKLNMIIGVFFSEAGTELLKSFSKCDIEAKEVSQKLIVKNSWSDREFISIIKQLARHEYNFDISRGKITNLRLFLIKKRDFFLSLLANPNLLDHDTFTSLLWAVFHLTDELHHRGNLDNISEKDIIHISVDIKRVYGLLILEWVSYMRHLKKDYPYLFSLALRTNPFDPRASVEIK